MRGEAPLLPVGEDPVPRTDLQEMLEGQTIVRVEWNSEPLPHGWSAVAFQIQTSAVVFIFAAPVVDQRFAYRFAWRWLNQQQIIHRSLERMMRLGPPSEMDAVQQRLVGQTIRGVRHAKEPNKWGGERLAFEFVSGEGFRLEIVPGARSGPLTGLIADIDGQWIGRGRT